MKKKEHKDEEYEIKFWKEWLEGDIIKRRELVENLPFVKEVMKLSRNKYIPEDMKKGTIVMQLNGFFEDLESAIYTKIRPDKDK